MYVALDRDYSLSDQEAPQSFRTPYIPLDPKYLVWPETAPGSAEKVNVWGEMHLDALTEGILSEKEQDVFSDIFGAKKDFLGRTTEDLLGLIYERENIKYDHMGKIDKESCYVGRCLRGIEDWLPGVDKNVDKIRSNAEKELLGLEREKRMEEVACWRDVTRLRSELREVMKEWSQEKRRDRIITGGKSLLHIGEKWM